MSIAFTLCSSSYSSFSSNKLNSVLHPSFPPSFSLRLRFILRPPLPRTTTSFFHNRRNLPFVLFSTGGGDSDFNGDRSSGGRGGGDRDDNVGDDDHKNKAIMVLAEGRRSLESVSSDLAATIKDGKIPASVVSRFLELEKSLFLRWLLQFNGFKECFLVNDLFLEKVGIECGDIQHLEKRSSTS